MRSFNLHQIPWQEFGADGSRYALLEGDRTRSDEGFSYLFELPAGCWDRPHWHSQRSRIVVLSGELRLATGGSFDKAAAPRYPAGSMLVVDAGEVHYDGCEVTTLVLGVARGPWETHYLTP